MSFGCAVMGAVVANLYHYTISCLTASVVYRSEILATDPEVQGSIPDATRFSEK
jgi:hypothetical protein